MKRIIFLSLTLLKFNLIYPQEVFKDILKNIDQLNQEVLNITALTDEEENKIGEQLDKKLMSQFKVVREYKFNVKEIFKRIKTHAFRQKINYRYSIIKDEDINAYSIAGGKVYLLSGLIDFIKNEDELAYVIAHEISHIDLKHCVKKIQYATIASGINPMLGDLVQVAYSVYNIPFSKEQEFEADKNAIELMKKAGYQKTGAITFLKRIAELEKKHQKGESEFLREFLSTHPETHQRIKKIEEY